MVINHNFWSNKSVFLTGHTGFKGGWMALWLSKMGAKVSGYSLNPPTNPNFFTETKLADRLASSTIADIQDFNSLKLAMHKSNPSIIIHMAAQPLVRYSYKNPIETFKTNLIGTINLLEATRSINNIEAVINVTTDKCYKNKEKNILYKESDRLGGFDPYSGSKACVELASEVYRNSFLRDIGVNLATVRAGNVIGGGDWATDRLIPDIFRSLLSKKKLDIRYPNAIRPWQHVIEPLSGYLKLAEMLVDYRDDFADSWNFGPNKIDSRSVSWIINYIISKNYNLNWQKTNSPEPHEAGLLLLDNSKAKSKLDWRPRWSLEVALDKTLEWQEAWTRNDSMDEISISQINDYENSISQ